MNRIKLLVSLSIAAALFATVLPASAEDGYVFNLQLTSENASKDPDGIWPLKNFRPFGNPPALPGIYTARLTTPAGQWLLTQLDNQCTMQSDCAFILVLKRPGGQIQQMAKGSVIMGGKATLSLNYRKITTEEVNDEIKPFTGSYDVKPIK